jgi:glycosyltransferase involved in cell wall biosynthesis
VYPDLSFVTYQDKIRRKAYNHQLNVRKVYILPFVNTFLNGIVRGIAVYRMLKKVEAEHDLMIVQFPFKTPFAPLVLSKPVVCHVCSNLLSASANPVKYKGLKGAIARAYARLLHYHNRRMFGRKNVRVVANGRELTELYKEFKVVPAVSSSLEAREIISPEEVKRRSGPMRILFVGRPSLEKGFDVLLDAITQIPKEHEFRLVFVGFTWEEFQEMHPDRSIDTDKIEFLGYVPFSQQLFDIYKSGHVLVLPSRSEGTPRVLIEARAMGCPVVASRVGGIPDSITDGIDGLLFPSGDGTALSTLLQELLANEDRRIELAIQGIHRARTMTLDNFLNIFVRIIDEQLGIDERQIHS